MATDTVNKNEWFINPSTPMMDLAQMLMRLDERGVIPDDMRQAIRMHADNTLDTAPLAIAAISRAIAGSATEGWLDADDTAQASYGVASLADKARAANELAAQFATPRKVV